MLATTFCTLGWFTVPVALLIFAAGGIIGAFLGPVVMALFWWWRERRAERFRIDAVLRDMGRPDGRHAGDWPDAPLPEKGRR